MASTEFSTLGWRPQNFTSSDPKPVDDESAHTFISFLTAAQELAVPFLPITWQAKVAASGQGATSSINQALVTGKLSLAFKCVSEVDKLQTPEDVIISRLINEMSLLRHAQIHGHPNLLPLLGICWHVSTTDYRQWRHDNMPSSKVWPVLVFQKSQLGNLKEFAESAQGRQLSTRERLELCIEIGDAIQHLHSISMNHGDIKPANILIFQDDGGRVVPKVADLGYSTFWYSDVDPIRIPQSWPWYAPECNEFPDFDKKQAIRADIFSFGMVCMWLLFERYLSGVDPIDMSLEEAGKFFNRGPKHESSNVLGQLKSEGILNTVVNQLVAADTGLDMATKEMLKGFFTSCLAYKSEERRNDVFSMLKMQPTPKPNNNVSVINDYDIELSFDDHRFNLLGSLSQFYLADFRLRSYIRKSLEAIVQADPDDPLASQLAMCYELGFGCSRIGNKDRCIAYDSAEVLSRLRAWNSYHDEIFCPVDTIHDALRSAARFAEPDNNEQDEEEAPPQEAVENYEGELILETAQRITQSDVARLTKVFSREHELVWDLKYTLSRLLGAQGRWREAERLDIADHNPTLIPELHWSLGLRNETQVMGTCIQLLRMATGNQFDERLSIISMVPRKYVTLEHTSAEYKMAKMLQAEVVEALRKTFGDEDPRTLRAMSDMAFICLMRCETDEAEEWQGQVLRAHIDAFGEAHPETLVSMVRMREIYFEEEDWGECFKMISKIREIRATLGIETDDKGGRKAWDDD
ncbi:kinase-like domain-containing protein [Nemania sp. NC0429]|nr:kinase-like domain-containing protein [Nemania sp. NC0429]